MTTLTSDTLAEWTPERERWHRRKFPSSWPEVKAKLDATRRALGMVPQPVDPAPQPLVFIEHRVIDWNLIKPKSDVTPPARFVRADDIINLCAKFGETTEMEMKSPRRAKTIARARMVAMYLMHKHTQLTYPQIGNKLGGRDHSTAMHAYRRVSDDLATRDGKEFGGLVKRVEGVLLG